MVKFLTSVLNWPVNSCSNLTLFFIVMTQKSPVNFKLIHFLLWIKGPNKSPNCYTFERALVKICQIPHVIFQTTSQFFFKFYMTLQCHGRYLLCTFLGHRLYTLHKRDQSKCKFWRLLSPRIKIHHILVIFETTNQFFNWKIVYHEKIGNLYSS